MKAMTTFKQIDWNTLVTWMKNHNQLTILDIRPKTERDEWFIPESTYYNAYDALKSGDKEALDNLEFDKQIPIITVCGKGRLSMFAAEILADKGVEAYSLEGGMLAWNNAYDTQEIIFADFKIIQIRRLAKGCLSYIIGSDKEAMVVDAALDPTVYQDIATNEGWQIKFVTDTHIHADYVSRTLELAKITNATHLFNSTAKVNYPFTPIQDGEIIHLGCTKIKVLFTAGHTSESTSFLIADEAILTGDTLFIDGVGRPDLKADHGQMITKAKMLYQSLHKITALNQDILIMPAHFSKPIFLGQPFITAELKQIKDNIPNLALNEGAFVEAVISKLPQTPSNYVTISEINKSGIYEGYSLAELEAGANRCAVS